MPVSFKQRCGYLTFLFKDIQVVSLPANISGTVIPEWNLCQYDGVIVIIFLYGFFCQISITLFTYPLQLYNIRRYRKGRCGT